jgi:Icc-related predicted phosphoesterase
VTAPDTACVRVAAVGDVHVGTTPVHLGLADVAEHADLLLLAGDLTRHGTRDEAAVLAGELDGLGLPVVAVLGNHDHEADAADDVVDELRAVGVSVVEQSTCEVQVGSATVGVAGTKGFGGGTAGATATEFGEPAMKAFVRHGAEIAAGLDTALAGLDTDLRLVLLHYSPVADTLAGEPLQIHPFLGDYRLAEAVDRNGADLVVHGHAHAGRERGRTPGGVPVRNVARPVIRSPYRVFELRVPHGAPGLRGGRRS